MSSAYIPAAAKIPACLIPPPSAFRNRLALFIKFCFPAIREPEGQDNPFDKQKDTLSDSETSFSTDILSFTDALNMRAPSICNLILNG